MANALDKILAFICQLALSAWLALASSALWATAPVWQLDVEGAIGPATADYIVRGLASATAEGAQLVVLRIDTPGGLDLAMRDIIQAILAAEVPVACYVAPAGARAASAGTYILYACHYAAMAPATNLGAATPVQIATPSLPGLPRGANPPDAPADPAQPDRPGQPKTDSSPPPASAMQKKIVNDAVAYIEGLANLRQRNAEWAARAVREGASLAAERALQLNVIDAIAENTEQLLAEIDGRVFTARGNTAALATRDALLVLHPRDWRNQFLAAITNPNVAYILMMIGVYGLFFEFSNPGMGVPGVAGAMCLVLALYAFQMLPVSYAGIALVLLGMALMIAEAVSPSFGVLGLGGVLAFVLGSIVLMDTELPGYRIALPVIAAFTAFSAGLIFILMRLVIKARQQLVLSGLDHLLQASGEVESLHAGQPMARFDGELWQLDCDTTLAPGDRIRVTGVDGLHLQATKIVD